MSNYYTSIYFIALSLKTPYLKQVASIKKTDLTTQDISHLDLHIWGKFRLQQKGKMGKCLPENYVFPKVILNFNNLINHLILISSQESWSFILL